MIDIALYQPDIPQNVGAMIRLCACMETKLHIIEPCSFPWDEKRIKKSAMDYVEKIKYERHPSWAAFIQAQENRRIVLMTTRGSFPYTDFEFHDGDILLAGSESSGVPEEVHENVDVRVIIPMAQGLRSLNIVNASAMILGESLRQTRWSVQ